MYASRTSNGVIPKKHLGQHFLKDDNIAARIVNSLTPETSDIIEIGAGTGVLTKHLVRKFGNRLHIIEIDKESIVVLTERFPELKNRILHADFLSYDFTGLFEGKFSVIGNFPYNISSQILFRIIENHRRVDEVIGMFQKEVAERIASPPGSKKYGILSVLTQVFYETEKLFEVSPHVFFPEPKVTSAVIRLKRNNRQNPVQSEQKLLSVVKSAFNQRRKTLRNALKNHPFPSHIANSSLFSRRAEQLTPDEFIGLADILSGLPD